MSVRVLVRGAYVYLDISGPYGMSDAYLGIEEIRPRSGVEHTLVDDLDFATIDSVQTGSTAPHLVLPDMLHQHLHIACEVTHFLRKCGIGGLESSRVLGFL